MNTSFRWIEICLVMGAALVAISCESHKEAASRGPSAPIKIANRTAADYSQPYLNDDKMEKFLASMKEEHNPLELMFKPGGRMQDTATMSSRIDEFNAYARKYGFQDYEDYTGVWGRITVGQMQIFAEKSLRDLQSGAQEELKKPDLLPEQKKMYEDQLASSQKQLDDMQHGIGHSLNLADVELVAKYKDQIDAAQKKYAAAK